MKKLWVLVPLVLLLTLAACKSTLLLDGSTPDTKPSTLPTEADPTESSVNPTEADPTEPSVPPTEPDVTQPSVTEKVICFVKEDEPTKLYCAPINDLSQQKVIYESEFGEINYVYVEELGAYANKVVTLTEGNKRIVLLDIATAEVLVVFDEAYYIKHGFFEGITEVDGKPYCDLILFDGKPTEDDRNSTYFYWVESGTFSEMPMQ